MSECLVVVGASHAGVELALGVRRDGFAGRLILIGAEPTLPYHRPPLSKAFLAGDKQLYEIDLRPAALYEKQGFELLRDTLVTAIDLVRKRVVLGDGNELAYDALALATGSRVRRLNVPGSTLDGIHYIRTVRDIESFRERLGPGTRMVIVGGGYIGLEVAAVSVRKGVEVTVLEAAPTLLSRVTAPDMASFYARVHREEGVEVRTGATVTGFTGGNEVESVMCSDGTRHAADLIVVGIGILPEVALAEAAGLEVDDGIVVDEHTRTSDPHIVAAGDCTNHPSRLYGRRVRLESVPNAVEQAKVAAATLCAKDKVYDTVPVFWSDQYELKLQIAGLSQGHDQVVIRGSMAERHFAAFYLRGGTLIAVDAVNSPAEFMAGKRLIAARAGIEPERLADTSVPMKEFLQRGGTTA